MNNVNFEERIIEEEMEEALHHLPPDSADDFVDEGATGNTETLLQSSKLMLGVHPSGAAAA